MTLGSAAYVSGASRLLAALEGRSHEPAVLGYHRVVADFPTNAAFYQPAMLVSRRMLERQLDWIAQRFQVVSLEELRARFEARRRPMAAITFDDACRDVYEHAFPLLIRKGIPATVFVATDYVGTTGVRPHDRLYLLLARAAERWPSFADELVGLLGVLQLPLTSAETARASSSVQTAYRTLLATLSQNDVHRVIEALDSDGTLSKNMRFGFQSMTWDMLIEMSRRGVVIGSHTKTHSVLTNEQRAQAIDEIAGSQMTLTKRLGKRITSFAYPEGRFDTAVVRIVGLAGYQTAVTTYQHRDAEHPWLTVPRILLWERSTADRRGRFSPAILNRQVNGLVHRYSTCAQQHGPIAV